MFKAVVKKERKGETPAGGFGTFLVIAYQGPPRQTFEAAQQDARQYMQSQPANANSETLVVEIEQL